MNYLIYSASDRGLRREINEDSHAQRRLPGGLLAIVADGVGGHPGGAFASALAVEQILQALEPAAAAPLSDRLSAACQRANAALRQAQLSHQGYEQMATTLVALLAEEQRAALLHAGDSRCYRWRQRRLSLLTRDHTLAEQMVDEGTITPTDAARSPYQHILTRGLGLAGQLQYSLREISLQPGDLYLLCSDGLSKPLSDAEIAAVLAQHPATEAAKKLIEAANKAGGPDNITVILIRCVE